MTTARPILRARWPTRFVILLLLLCGFYSTYRAVHLAITSDEVNLLTCVHQTGYARLFLGDGWDSQAQFLNALLAKPCVEFLPLNEIVASRLPSLLGLALFLWGVWRIGLEFPTGPTRVLITLALLSNAYLLDFFGLSRGYGLALGFTVVSLSFLMQASMVKSAGDESARRQAAASLWLAFGSALSNMGFLYFYVALLAVIIWLSWSNRLKVRWWISAMLLGVFYVHRILVTRSQNLLYFGGDIGFVHDTAGSLMRASFYDWSVSAGLVTFVSGGLALLVLVLAYWSHREHIRAAFTLSVLGILVAALCVAVHRLWGVKYPEERAALYLVPLVILAVGVVAALSRLRWLRLCLWGLLLAFTGVGLQGANLSHTLTWRACADLPSVLLALREVHQQTGQDVTLAFGTGMRWTIWYYAEHLLGLHHEPIDSEWAYLKILDWFGVYEWRPLQTHFRLPPDNLLMPGTTHLLLNLLDRDDEHLLATPPPGGFMKLRFYPASDTMLLMLATPQHQGAVTYPKAGNYVGEFKHGLRNGRGTFTWPDGRKYVGEFKDDAANGQGTCTWPDGQKYVGGFKDGKMTGQGAETWPDGRTYVGEFKDGAANGQGTATWLDGRKYVGGFKDGAANGQGTFTWPDGRKYVGEFKDGATNGQGTSTWPDGQKYVGGFKDGKMTGQGTYTWPDGRKYVGESRDGQMDGVGKMTYPDGRVDDGLWKQGQFAGTAPH